MTNLERAHLTWTGGVIGTGVSTFYALPGSGVLDALRTFFEAVKADLSNTATIHYPDGGDVIDSATGHLVDAWTAATAHTPTTGTGGGFTAAPAGAVVNWLTTTIIPVSASSKTAHRIHGRTFLVPLATNSYDSDGTLQSGAVTTIQTAANALISTVAGGMVIWHRPEKGGSTGAYGPVTSATVNDRVAMLTSRRN